MANVLEESDLDLEHYCGKCFGTGAKAGAVCENCEGAGYYLTQFGERVLKFMVKRMQLHYTAIALENLKKFADTE